MPILRCMHLARLARIALTRRRGSRAWNAMLWTTGALGVLAIGLVLLVPAAAGMVGFGLVTIWVHGPVTPFVPVAYEALVVVMGRVTPPLIVASVGSGAMLLVEWMNYLLLQELALLGPVRRSLAAPVARRMLELFRRRPFFAVWLCAWSPLPFWIARVLAPVSAYPLGRYLLATFLGRFPRLWLFAALGVLWTGSLTTLALGSAVVALIGAVAVGAWRRLRQADPVPSVDAVRKGTSVSRSDSAPPRARYRPFPNVARRNFVHASVEVPLVVRLLHLPAGGRVLEVGCGRGVALPVLERLLRPSRLVGVDIDIALLAQARDRLRRHPSAAELRHADVRSLPFHDGAFDLVVDFGTCYHIAEPQRAVREIHRVLAPGGIFVYETPLNQLLGHPVRSFGRRIPWDVAPFAPRRGRLMWGSRRRP